MKFEDLNKQDRIKVFMKSTPSWYSAVIFKEQDEDTLLVLPYQTEAFEPHERIFKKDILRIEPLGY